MKEKDPAERLVNDLSELGFTSYEARVFAALTRLREASAGEISAVAGVPRSAVYDVLEKLEGRQIIESSAGRPRRFRALPPQIAMSKIESRLLEATKNAGRHLDDISKSSQPEASDALIWLSRGKNVEDRVRHLISSAKRELIAAGNTDYLLELGSLWRAAKKRGVSIVYLTGESDDSDKLRRLGKVVIPPFQDRMPKEFSNIFILSADRRTVLFTSTPEVDEPSPERTAFWSNNEALVKFLIYFMESLYWTS